jgi:glycine oxidase
VKQPDLAIVGGGLLGRLLAWRASRQGLTVSLHEAGSPLGEQSAAWAAAGMITPAAEAVDADAEIVAMGRHSLTLWPQWLAQLPCPVFYRDSGTIMLWHRENAGEARRFEAMLKARDTQADLLQIDARQMSELEPAVGTGFPKAFYLAGEAQIDNRALLSAVAAALKQSAVECHWNTPVVEDAMPQADIVVDCRGMGARRDWPQLRGVRGEIARLHAPEVKLRHMLRLLHPRYSVYIVPRAEGNFIVGATSIESDDRSAVSVRGALELLSSAYSLLPALAEARILEFATQVRPALPDNRPAFRFDARKNILRVNGLYRHGFLLSPTVVEEVLALLSAPKMTGFTGQWDCLREPSIVLPEPEMKVPECLSL